ncbi:hypothetical protein [Glycomyces sp. NPDC021274]|uniref:hypothetical protein n=1 Tax=Glycomyces sp. NPDC021274 TaxID=3155120 RepID=UPI0033DEE5C0
MTTDLAAIRDRDETDFVTTVESCSSGLAQDLMQARLDRRDLLAELDRLTARPTDTRTTTQED